MKCTLLDGAGKIIAYARMDEVTAFAILNVKDELRKHRTTRRYFLNVLKPWLENARNVATKRFRYMGILQRMRTRRRRNTLLEALAMPVAMLVTQAIPSTLTPSYLNTQIGKRSGQLFLGKGMTAIYFWGRQSIGGVVEYPKRLRYINTVYLFSHGGKAESRALPAHEKRNRARYPRTRWRRRYRDSERRL